LREAFQGRASARVRDFALYGDTTGETDEFGLPVRYPWAREYRGHAMVLYGHTPVPEPEWVNNTLCLDTGCVFGGQLTALRYPEREIVSVDARQTYYQPARPLRPDRPAVEQPDVAAARDDDVLDIDDVLGPRVVQTGHAGRVTIREANAAAAIEVMSRFAIAPAKLLYLPPTMSPPATSNLPGLLEHPSEAFAYYHDVGVTDVVCEEKHMGSRAVVLVARHDRHTDPSRSSTHGAVYTRTGRSFFDPAATADLLARLAAAADTAGIFDELGTDWLLLDTEILPWSAKAGDLIRNQYASVGAAARAVLPAAVDLLTQGAARGLDLDGLLATQHARAATATAFTEAYRRYCWPTDGLTGVTVAPFQILASHGTTYHDHPHHWHLGIADRLATEAPHLIARTERRYLDLSDPAAVSDATLWWEQLTQAGGEGMVVKPAANLTTTARGLAQPGIKVRGREYLRIIYGPDYTHPDNLSRLRDRNLGRKRSLAQREYALGLEALERHARHEPLWRIHECAFAILALESEPVDPRL
jgi:protein phosphatase